MWVRVRCIAGPVCRGRGLAHQLDRSVSLLGAECGEVKRRLSEVGTAPWTPCPGHQVTAQSAAEKVGDESRWLPAEGSAWFPSLELGLLLARQACREESG